MPSPALRPSRALAWGRSLAGLLAAALAICAGHALPAAARAPAAPFEYQGQDYFRFADGSYCPYKGKPTARDHFSPGTPPAGPPTAPCGPATVGRYENTTAAGTTKDAPRAQVIAHQGAMSFMLNGAPSFGHGFTAQCPGNVLSEYPDLLGGAVKLPLARLSFPLADVYHACGATGAVGAWTGGDPANPSSYHWGYLDKLLATAMKGSAATRVLLLVAIDGSLPWVYAHPDCTATAVPLPDPAPKALPAMIPEGFACLSPEEQSQRMLQGIPDYLSPEWVSTSNELLHQLVAHIEASPYAQDVVGYELMTGASLDNNYPISTSSPQALKRFQSFLGERYGTSGQLAAAWGQPGLNFETAKPLTAQQAATHRSCPAVPASDPGLPLRAQLAPLLVPARAQAYTDTRAFTVEENQQFAFNFADAIKSATHGQAVVGVRAGEFPQQQVWCNEQANSLQWHTLDFFSYPAIDFYEVWEHYGSARFFGPSGGGGEPLMPVQGLAALHKLYVVQNDFTAYWPQNPHADKSPTRGYVEGYPGFIQKARRVFVNALINGMSEYLWQLRYSFGQPELYPEWAQETQIAQTALKADRSSVAELAYVMDPGTGQYLADAFTGGYHGSPQPNTNANNFFDEPGQQMVLTQYPTQSWARSGVPYDTIFLEQLATAKPYRVYVFFNTIGLSEAQVAAIKSQLSARHAVGIFVYADGMVDGHGNAPLTALGTNIAHLTGMPVAGSTLQRPAAIEPTEAYRAAGGIVGDPGRWDFQPAAGTGLSPVTGMLQPGSRTAPMTPYLYPSFTIHAAADPSLTVLATYARCGGHAGVQDCKNAPEGAAAIAEKALPGGGEIIYSATPYLPPGLMRYALAKAGAFQYAGSEDDLYLDQSFLGIHTMDGSQRDGSDISQPLTEPILEAPIHSQAGAGRSWKITVRFAQPTALYDVFNHVEYPASAVHRLPVSADSTYLYFRGTQADWQRLGG